MASAAATAAKILFSQTVSAKATIRITPTEVYIEDTSGEIFTFEGGTDKYEIKVVDVGGKKSKSITIRALLDRCHFSKQPITPKDTLVMKQGYILDQHRFVLNENDLLHEVPPVYYCEIGNVGMRTVYAVVKYTDRGYPFDARAYAHLSKFLNSDLLGFIQDKLAEIPHTGIFMMVNRQLILGQKYSRRTIRRFVDAGLLEIATGMPDPADNRCIILTEDAFSVPYHNHRIVRIHDVFLDVDRMKAARASYIQTFLG